MDQAKEILKEAGGDKEKALVILKKKGAEAVAKIRSETAGRTTPWTAAELLVLLLSENASRRLNGLWPIRSEEEAVRMIRLFFLPTPPA